MFGLNGLAYSIYEPMLELNPEDAEAVRGMVEYYQRIGDNRHGLELVESWLERHPDDQVLSSKRDELKKLTGKADSGLSRAQ